MRPHSVYVLVCKCGHTSEVEAATGTCPNCKREYEILWRAPVAPDKEPAPWSE